MKETFLLAAFGLAAATAAIIALRIGGDDGRPKSSGESSRMTEVSTQVAPAESPEERAMHAAYLVQYSRRKFAPLFAMLPSRVTPAQVERLRELLSEREIAMASARQDAAKAGMSLESYFEKKTGELRSRTTAELGDDVWQLVAAYFRTLPQRLMMAGVDQILVYRGEGLTISQIEGLCELINRHEVPRPGAQTSRADWDDYVAKKQTAYRKVLADAGSMVTPRQLEILRQELEVQLAQLKYQACAMRLGHEAARNDENPKPFFPAESNTSLR